MQDRAGGDVLWQFDLANPNAAGSFLNPMASYLLPQNVLGGFPLSSMLGISVQGNTLYALQDRVGGDVLWQFDLANPNAAGSFLNPMASYLLPQNILGDFLLTALLAISVADDTLYALQDRAGGDVLWQFDLANPNAVGSYLNPMASYALPQNLLGEFHLTTVLGISVPATNGPGGGGGSVSVPEPSGLALVGMAMAAIIGMRRRATPAK